MAKTIDKQTMLGLIVEAKRTDPETGSFAEWLAEYLVEHLPTLTPPNEWVSVEERLPEPDFPGQQRGFYLVALSNGTVKGLMYEFRHYENMMFDVGWHETAFPVTHWMMLPRPPKVTEDVAFSATTESGCEYCCGEPMRPLDWQYGLDHIFPDYKYCPMCGRRVQK